MKKALITGIGGQTGSYLAELLKEKGYEVHGIIRRASLFNTNRIDHLYKSEEELKLLHNGDLQDGSSLQQIIDKVEPDEIYNLGAQSHVRVSFDMPEYTHDVVAGGTLRLLECIRRYQKRTKRQIKFYQASSSEMFGNSRPLQHENTEFDPCSPYAVAKCAAHHFVQSYRKSYGLYAACGILFNHESERRTETFVTRKITRAATRIKEGLQDKLYLGNMEARRDWGAAYDYVSAIYAIMQQPDRPQDFVIATGTAYSVRQFCELVFLKLDLDYRQYVIHDPRLLRPSEVGHLQGDASKAKYLLNWVPSVGFESLVNRMIEHDHNLAKQELLLKNAGYSCRVR